jgi:hypothetical protein
MRTDSIRYLKSAGFDFKSAESPDLWSHLESHFAEPPCIGPKFMSLPAARMAELIDRGEVALLEALAAHHLRTGRLTSVAQVIEMPFVVGSDGTIPLKDADKTRLLKLIDQPGTAREHIVHILPAKADAIPATYKVTITGGIYLDGHTAGFFALHPGSHPDAETADAWLATPDEIKALARDMERKIEDITLVTRKECEAMIANTRKILGF